MNKKEAIAMLGSVMGDLVAGTHALVTENETGPLLDVRIRQLIATADSYKLLLAEVKNK